MPVSQLLLALGAGLAAAALFASLLTGSTMAFLFAYLAPLPIFAAGLAFGVGVAAVAGATGMVATIVIDSMMFALVFAVLNVLAPVVLTRQAMLNRATAAGGIEWYPPGALLLWLAGLVIAVFIALVVYLSGFPGGMEGQLQRSLTRVFQAGGFPQEFSGASAEQMTRAIARFLPGIVAVSWMVMSALNGVLAQALLKRFGWNLRPSPRMADIRLPSWMPVAGAIAAVGAFMPGFAGFIGGNLLLIALAVFAFAGLAVIHAMAGAWKNRMLWLVLIYTVMIIFTWPVILVAVLGVAETWMGWRHRFISRPPRS